MAQINSWHIRANDFFVNEQKYVAGNFPDLHFKVENGFVFLIGKIHISTNVNNKIFSDDFWLRIKFPQNYPELYPTVFEPHHKIPSDFHTNPDYSLCLGTEIEISQIFFQHHTIEAFLNKLVIPYLISFVYYRDYGELPFGQRSHGLEGKLEYYNELLNTKNIPIIIKFLLMVEKKKLRGHILCPCQSGKKLRNCHMNIIHNLMVIPKPLIRKEIIELKKQSIHNFT
jgi:hypothetical protein